ncbi:hypothetical protein V6N13_044886 [Hibiscus sabdariffa]
MAIILELWKFPSSNLTPTQSVTLIPSDGIGPLVTGAVVQAVNAPVYFERYEGALELCLEVHPLTLDNLCHVFFCFLDICYPDLLVEWATPYC